MGTVKHMQLAEQKAKRHLALHITKKTSNASYAHKCGSLAAMICLFQHGANVASENGSYLQSSVFTRITSTGIISIISRCWSFGTPGFEFSSFLIISPRLCTNAIRPLRGQEVKKQLELVG